ncbi:NAD-dependent epimerase/dehydratase family protein [Rhizobium sp. YIM 134829]|uniref:NAD-dependent epimerase/dehydratase family protein n=1 Tax=Rhizobium sp. YIM 134829 TaxID=3390453 RepID=UPI00397AE706
MTRIGPKTTALVLGATGGIGGAVMEGLVGRGATVRALSRNAGAAADRNRLVDWRQGDAMEAKDVLDAAKGVDIIVHAVNPPRYRHWDRLVLPMLENTIAAARATGATILLPGTTYNFGPDAFPLIEDDAPQNPMTSKGRIRKAMEDRLRAAADEGVRSIVLRAGDFFGAGAGNSWFAQVLVSPGRPVNTITLPGDAGIGHQWAYLPDVAAAMLGLLDRRDSLNAFEAAQFGGTWDADGLVLARSISRVLGRSDIKLRGFPWWTLPFAAPFSETVREIRKMRYLWRQPVQMDNAKLISLIGEEPQTPLDQAVYATLRGLGCLQPDHMVRRAGEPRALLG